jgi:hypothetical protein
MRCRSLVVGRCGVPEGGEALAEDRDECKAVDVAGMCSPFRKRMMKPHCESDTPDRARQLGDARVGWCNVPNTANQPAAQRLT